MMIHFLPVLVIVLFFREFWGDTYTLEVLIISFLCYTAIIIETTAYMYPKSRKLFKRFFPWLFIPFAVICGYGGYIIGTEVFKPESGLRQLSTLFASIGVGFGVFVWTYLGMSLILKASRAIYTKKAAIEADVRFATEVQKRILQDVIIEHRSACAYAKSVPANELGGDFFELTRRNDTIFACVGDVSGHSFGAGILMTMTKSALKTHLEYNQNPAEIAGALNKLFLSQSDRSMYSTMTLLKYDTSTQKAVLCNAGHLPVLHYRTERENVEEQYKKGLGLGMIGSAGFENQVFNMEKGDILFLYSDGLIETRDEKGDIRDIDFFKQILFRSIQQKRIATEELSEIIFSKVRESDHAEKFEDDATLIILNA